MKHIPVCNKESFAKNNLNRSIRKNIYFLFGLLGTSTLSACSNAIIPVFYQKIIDDIIPENNKSLLIIIILIIVAIPIINALLATAEKKISFVFSQRCCTEFSKKIFCKLIHSRYDEISKYNSVRLAALFTREADHISNIYLQSITTVTTNIIKLIIIFLIISHYSIKIAIISLLVLPLFFWIINSQKKKLGSVSNQGLKAYTDFEKKIIQTLNGIKTVKSYNAEDFECNAFGNNIMTRYNAEWRFRNLQNTVNNILPTLISQLSFGCIFAFCAILVMNKNISFGALVAIISYVPTLISSLKSVIGVKIGSSIISKTLTEYDNIAMLKPETKSEIYPAREWKYFLEMKNVDFSYGRENFILHINNLKIKKGDFVAIVGNSGGGKSSVIDIICKFFPILSGKVKIMGNKIEDIDTEFLRNSLSLVSQDIFMFNDTIENNISFPTKPDSTKINRVIEKAQLVDFINSMPQKEQTIVSDFGANLSGGECQRISLARALYRDAPVMLLDEPTSALDAKTSKKIFDMLKSENETKGKTIVVVTHEIKKALYANKVIVINDGEIVEFGTPDELLALENSMFKSLYDAQNKFSKN